MKVAVIGLGKMGEAIVASLIRSRSVVPHEIFASDVSADRRNAVKRQYSINVYSKNSVPAGEARVVFLAVKPQELGPVLEEIAPVLTAKHLVISIAAGRRIAFLQSRAGEARVIRVMPNLACVVGEGMSVFCAGRAATASDKATAARLLGCFGKVLEMPESCFDAVTALSGSGPAFFCHFLLCMVEAGVKEGLDRGAALALAQQTMLGTSRLLAERRLSPESLIEAVASPKGTTAAGLAALRKSSLPAIVERTVRAAASRSAELGE
jgi:pyrroline-5-carboxylate reductase